MFFGLKKNGNYYFDDKPTKIIEIENEDNYERFHSRLIFVRDNNNQKEYLLSTGYEKSLTELYDLDTFNYIVKNTVNITGREIFSYSSSLFELKFENKLRSFNFIFISRRDRLL